MDKLETGKKFIKELDFPEVEEAYIYGSVARGDDEDSSDIDILLVSRDKKKTKGKVYSKVTDYLTENGVYISVKVIETEELENIKETSFIRNVSREGIKVEG